VWKKVPEQPRQAVNANLVVSSLTENDQKMAGQIDGLKEKVAEYAMALAKVAPDVDPSALVDSPPVAPVVDMGHAVARAPPRPAVKHILKPRRNAAWVPYHDLECEVSFRAAIMVWIFLFLGIAYGWISRIVTRTLSCLFTYEGPPALDEREEVQQELQPSTLQELLDMAPPVFQQPKANSGVDTVAYAKYCSGVPDETGHVLEGRYRLLAFAPLRLKTVTFPPVCSLGLNYPTPGRLFACMKLRVTGLRRPNES